MFDRAKIENYHFGGGGGVGEEILLCIPPIIRTTEHSNKTPSPEDFKFTRFYCINSFFRLNRKFVLTHAC